MLKQLIAGLMLTGLAMGTVYPAEPPVDVEKFLRKHFWVIETRLVPGKQITPPLMQTHLAHQVRLEKAGILFAAGPVVTEGETPFGMIVIRAASRDEARKIADSDPLHQGGFRRYVLRDWMVNEGRVNVKLNFSDGTYTFE
jgi:uncharacterized protein YciI